MWYAVFELEWKMGLTGQCKQQKSIIRPSFIPSLWELLPTKEYFSILFEFFHNSTKGHNWGISQATKVNTSVNRIWLSGSYSLPGELDLLLWETRAGLPHNAFIKDAKDITLVSQITDKKQSEGAETSCPVPQQKHSWSTCSPYL